MTTRRSRFQIKPNLGPKLNKLTAARPKPSSPIPASTDKPIPIDNENINKNTEASLTVIKTTKSQPTEELVPKPSPLKSPNKSESNVVKALYKPDSSIIRGFRNRLPKAKPNITPRGAIRSTQNKLPSPAKSSPVDKTAIDQPNSAITSPDNIKKGTDDTVVKPVNTVSVVQDENRPVSNENDDTSSVLSESVSETTCNREKFRERRLSVSPVKIEKPSKKRRKSTFRKFPENEPPDRQKMKMSDMIYWNPTSNPMKQSNKTKKTVETSKPDLVSPTKDKDSSSSSPVKDADDTSNDSMPVPQVTIGPDGSMIINEQSLVIETEKETSHETTSQFEVSVEDDDMFVNYNSFRNKGPTKSWFDNETARFYRALSCLGTDFSLMSSLFPHRSRRELKNKFKREEKYNRKLVDAAIRNRQPLNLDSFESIESVLEQDKQDREQKRKKNLKRKRTEMKAETSESKEKKEKENEEDETTSPSKASPKKRKSVTKSKSKKKKTTTDKSKESESPTVKTINKVAGEKGFSEYDFEDETEPLPARLPKLKKSPQFKEFRNTAARKLRNSQSQPVSEDEDESDEDEEVDVLDSDSDLVADQPDAADDNEQQIKNNVTQSGNNEPMETCVSPIPQTQDSVVIDSQATIFSDLSQELPCESVNLSQMSPASSPESEIMDTQESTVSNFTTGGNKTFSPFTPLKSSQPALVKSPPKAVMKKLSKNILSPTPVTQLLTLPVKNSSKSPNQEKSVTKPGQNKFPENYVHQNSSPSPMRQLLTSPVQKSSKSSDEKEAYGQRDSSAEEYQENSIKNTHSRESEKSVEPSKETVSQKSTNSVKEGVNQKSTDSTKQIVSPKLNYLEETVSQKSKISKDTLSQKSNISEDIVSQKSTNTVTETESRKSKSAEEIISQKSTKNVTETVSQKSNAAEEIISQNSSNNATETVSPILQKSKSPKRTVEPKKAVVGKSTIVPTQLLSRRKKFQPNVNIQRKKTLPEKTTSEPQKESEVMEDVELINSSKESSMSPRIGVIKSIASTPKTESEKLQLLCQSQQVSDNDDDDDDDENEEVDIIDCDEFIDDGQPIMNIVKMEPDEDHMETNEEPCSVVESEHVQEHNIDVQNTDMDTSDYVENTSENNIGDEVNTSCDEPSTSSGHDLVVSSSNTNTSIMTSPNLTSGLRTVKNKSKTTPISQRYQKPNIESTATLSKDKIDLTKRIVLDSSVITEGSPHFVLPANVFPNLPFNQGEEKMQMVLVPETKDGETIYHVYMLPETEENKNTDSSKNSNTDKEVEAS